MTANQDTDLPNKSSYQPPISVRLARAEDLPAITKVHQRALGPGRYALTAYRVREGTPPISDFCQVAECGKHLLAAVRFTSASIGGQHGRTLARPHRRRSRSSQPGFGPRVDRRRHRPGPRERRTAHPSRGRFQLLRATWLLSRPPWADQISRTC